jgi:hypothetical protein
MLNYCMLSVVAGMDSLNETAEGLTGPSAAAAGDFASGVA